MKDYPLITVTILYVMGIILSRILNPVFNLNLFVVIIAVIFLFLIISNILRSSELLKTILISLLIISFGIVSYSIANNEIHKYPFKETKIKNVLMYGIINDIELNKEYEIKMLVHADSLKVNDHLFRLNNSFLCRVREESRKKFDSVYNIIRIGNYVQIKGVITKGREQRNPGEFDYQNYLEQKGISGILTCYSVKDFSIVKSGSELFPNLILNARRSIEQSIERLHNRQTAALLKGLLIGDRSEISDETKTDFINTGVVHVLAVSGLHVAYILLIFVFIFGRLNIYLRAVLTILGILSFIYLTGATASVVRSAIMGIVIIVAFLTNRTTNIYNSISVSALIILIINPLDLFDPGLQLSYSAVISIVVFTPFFKRRIIGLGIENLFLKKFLLFCTVSLAAQIGTIPFTLFYFRKLSLISLIANIIIVPLTGGMISLGILTLFLSILWLKGALLFSSVNNICTSFLYDITHRLSSFQFSYLSINQFSLLNAIFFYLMIFLFFYFYEKTNSGKAKLILFALTFANIILISSIDDKNYFPGNKLSIAAIDVGQGDSFLIRFPSGKTALIDAGDATQYFDNGERVIMPLLKYLGIEQIDYGFISHVDSDHYAGFISLVHNGIVKEIYKPVADTLYKKDVRLEKFLKENNVPVHYYRKNIIKVGNTRIYILNNINDPEYSHYEMNDKSGIIKLVYGKKRFLFVGDAEKRAEKNLVNCYKGFLKSDLLKLGHHGSSSGSSDEFLDNVNPEFALISAGQNNKFNHPSKIVLQRLEERKIKSFRTDKLDCIIFNCDGKNITARNWKSL